MTMTSAPPLRVLHAAAEIFPLVKTGGLADVIGALPPALATAGADDPRLGQLIEHAPHRAQRHVERFRQRVSGPGRRPVAEGARALHGIAGVAQFLELHALDDAPRVDVETRDDPAREHEGRAAGRAGGTSRPGGVTRRGRRRARS